MVITDIVKAKGSRYTINVDDEYWFILDSEIIVSNHLKIGMQVDEDSLDELKMQAERRKARERAYYLLGYRDHSKQELFEKLKKSAREEIALSIVLMVEEQGLIDDEAYAGKLARNYRIHKKWGDRKCLFEMQHRGIERSLAIEAISEVNDEIDVNEQIIEILDKKYSLCLDEYNEKQKVIAALARRGFGYDQIKEAIATYKEK